MSFFSLVLYVIFLLLRPQDWYDPLQGFRLIDVTAIGAVIATFTTQNSKEGTLATLRDDMFSRLFWGLFAWVILSEVTKFRLTYALEAFQDLANWASCFSCRWSLWTAPRAPVSCSGASPLVPGF